MEECRFAERCCFYRKYRGSVALMWRSLIRDYCHGGLHQRCERRQFYLETGECAPSHLIPSGEIAGVLLDLR